VCYATLNCSYLGSEIRLRRIQENTNTWSCPMCWCSERIHRTGGTCIRSRLKIISRHVTIINYITSESIGTFNVRIRAWTMTVPGTWHEHPPYPSLQWQRESRHAPFWQGVPSLASQSSETMANVIYFKCKSFIRRPHNGHTRLKNKTFTNIYILTEDCNKIRRIRKYTGCLAILET
jgi:hypothetical protein